MARNTEQTLKDILVEQIGVNPDQITPEANFIEDLGCDSLDTVELVMAVEEEFHIEIQDEDADKIKTFGDALKYVTDKVGDGN